MGLLKRFGGYRISVKCPNCGYGSEIKVTRGVSVADFTQDGKCKCDNCQVVFYPEEYTTEHFEKEKKKDMNVNIKKDYIESKGKDKEGNIKW